MVRQFKIIRKISEFSSALGVEILECSLQIFDILTMSYLMIHILCAFYKYTKKKSIF